MKKITLLVAAAAAIFTSCSKTENVENPTQQTPISFKHASVVKAAMNQGFTVMGYKSEAILSDWAVAPYFTEAYAADGTIESGKVYYYDGKSFYNFVGFAPATDASIVPTTGAVSPSVAFTTPDAANVDLLAAKAAEIEGKSENAVALKFNHVLAKVKFSALTATPDAKIVLTGITFKALPEATLDLTTGTMGAASGTEKIFTISGLNASLTTTEAPIATEFMVVPQDLTGLGEIVVSYTIDGVVAEPKTIALTNTLKSNGVVKYKITVDAESGEITFAPEEEAWDTESTTEVPPIK